MLDIFIIILNIYKIYIKIIGIEYANFLIQTIADKKSPLAA